MTSPNANAPAIFQSILSSQLTSLAVLLRSGPVTGGGSNHAHTEGDRGGERATRPSVNDGESDRPKERRTAKHDRAPTDSRQPAGSTPNQDRYPAHDDAESC